MCNGIKKSSKFSSKSTTQGIHGGNVIYYKIDYLVCMCVRLCVYMHEYK